MPTFAQLLFRLESTFGPGDERLVAELLIDFLIRHQDTSHVNLQLLRQITPNGSTGKLDHVILRTLQFLAGDGVALLETMFEIHDDDQQPYGLDRRDVKEALALKVNPITGDFDPNIATKISMYFSPIPAALKQLADSR